jgi:peroxin-1
VLRDRFARAPTIETDEESPINYAALATRTDGYSAGDLEDLVVRAIHVAATRRSEGGKDARVRVDVTFSPSCQYACL